MKYISFFKLFISTGLFFRLFISAHIIFKSKSFYLKVCALMYVYVILTYIVKIILSLNEFHHALLKGQEPLKPVLVRPNT